VHQPTEIFQAGGQSKNAAATHVSGLSGPSRSSTSTERTPCRNPVPSVSETRCHTGFMKFKWGKLHLESFKHLLHPFALLINVEKSGAPLLMLMPSRSCAVLSSNCGWFPWAFPPAGCQSSWCFHMTEMPGFGQSRHCSIDNVTDTVTDTAISNPYCCWSAWSFPFQNWSYLIIGHTVYQLRRCYENQSLKCMCPRGCDICLAILFWAIGNTRPCTAVQMLKSQSARTKAQWGAVNC